jgi:hypothetical protein
MNRKFWDGVKTQNFIRRAFRVVVVVLAVTNGVA